MPACPVAPADGTGAVIFFACLDLEQKSSFMDGHLLRLAWLFGFRCQVSGVRDYEQRRWHLTPDIREGINMGYFLNPYYGQF
jgi:hypothetical protein